MNKDQAFEKWWNETVHPMNIHERCLLTFVAAWNIQQDKIDKLTEALRELVMAVTSKGAEDTRDPIAWSGSPSQNRRMHKALSVAKEALSSVEK